MKNRASKAKPPSARDVEGPEWMRVIYHRLRSKVESLNGRVKNRVAYSRLTWQGLENARARPGRRSS